MFKNDRILELTKLINKYYPKRHIESKYKKDFKFNLYQKMSRVIGCSLKGNKKGRKWGSFVNYNLDDLIKHLEQTFPKGYSWKDFTEGKLHIDHIIPKRAFVFSKPEDEEFKQCWSLYNLRLLTAKDNVEKNCKIDNPILLGLLLNRIKSDSLNIYTKVECLAD